MDVRRTLASKTISATVAAAAGLVAAGSLAAPGAGADEVNACNDVDPHERGLG
jgi:hypothetical protein